MDNFKKPKKQVTGSLDGFLGSKPSHGKKLNNLDAFNRYHLGSGSADDSLKIGRLDDFKGPDGFLANEQAPIYQPADRNKPAELGMENSNDEDKTGKAALTNKKTRRRLLGRLRSRMARKRARRLASRHPKLRLWLKISGITLSVLILVGGGLALKYYLTVRGVFKGGGAAAALTKNVDPLLLKGEGDGRVNILLLGKGGAGHVGPDLTDTLLLASIDPVANEAALLSTPRDLWVKSAASGYESKINEVYINAKNAYLSNYLYSEQGRTVREQATKAGIKAIQDTLSNVLGIPIHYYVMIDFEAFKQAVDAVGGVDINVKKQLYDPSVAWENNYNPVIANAGLQHFDGKKALLYARSRYGSAKGDFDRAARQREIISALKTKIFTLGTFANPLKVNQLLNTIGKRVSTDLTVSELMRIYEIGKEIQSDKILSVGLDDYVMGGGFANLSVQVPKLGTFNYGAIHNFVRNSLKDSYLKSENASVVILNGTTTPGLATLKSTELKSYGYNVIRVGDAPTQRYTKTVLVDLTNGVKRYTKSYLEKRIGVSAVTALPESIKAETADFVIILGSNEPTAQ